MAVAELDGHPPAGRVRLIGHTGGVRAVAVAELDGRPVVVSGGDDGRVTVWELAAGQVHAIETGAPVRAIVCVCVSSLGIILASAAGLALLQLVGRDQDARHDR